MKKFFGDYDLLGHPVMIEPHGKITVFNDRYTQCHINEMENGVDIVFNGFHSIGELIARLTRLRDDMAKLAAKNQGG